MNTVAKQLEGWTVQRAQRVELGDRLDGLRPVDHFAYFKRNSAARRAAETLRSAGFTVTISRRGLKNRMSATREETLGDDVVGSFVGEVVAVVEGEGGEYDGWGAPIAQ